MPKPPTVRDSRKQEQRVAKEYQGGRQVIGSGAIPGIDGDVKGDEDFVECKVTRAKQFTLKLSDWEKTVVEGVRAGRAPAMRVTFLGVPGIISHYDLVVIDLDAYQELRRKAGELE